MVVGSIIQTEPRVGFLVGWLWCYSGSNNKAQSGCIYAVLRGVCLLVYNTDAVAGGLWLVVPL